MYACVSGCMYACYMQAGVCGGQERVLDPLELELQIVVNHLTWVLGTEQNLGPLKE